MTVTFDGVLLADGESRVAKVASGLAPSGEVQMEVLEYLEADWASPVARGNRVLTLPMVIEFPAAENFGAALVHALMYFANLPTEGLLIIAHGEDQVSYPAVCRSVKQVEAIEGLAHAVALQFVCGEPTIYTPSTLSQLDMNTIANLFSVTGLTGGGSTKLDGYVTVDVTVGFAAFLPSLMIGGVPTAKLFQLIGGTDAENADPALGKLIIHPDDHGPSNSKIWVERL
jgi:hypothetical protein